MTEYPSVESMAKAVYQESFSEEDLAAWEKNTQFTYMLLLNRIKSGLTEEDVAKATGWTKKQVMEFEGKVDSDVSLGELLVYLKATKLTLNMSLNISDVAEPVVSQLERSIDRIKNATSNLAEMAGEDEKIIDEALKLLNMCISEVLETKSTLAAKIKKEPIFAIRGEPSARSRILTDSLLFRVQAVNDVEAEAIET